MGFMSNSEEDVKMSQPEYKEKMVQGIANGIDKYLKGLKQKRLKDKEED